MPKISICIPSYKQAGLLRQALNSIQIQSFTDYEVIITDDTPDESIKDLVAVHPLKEKIKYHKNPQSLGSPANWNASLEKASGEYIKILHHDDYFTSGNSLQEFVNMLDANPNVDFAFSGTLVDLVQLKMKNTHRCSESKLNKIKADPSQLFFANLIGAPSATIFKKKATILFDEQMKWLVDIDWYIRLLKGGSGLVNTPKTLICTVHGSEGQVTQEVINLKDVQIKEHVMLFSKLYNPQLNLKKYSLLFQVLFNKYSVNTMVELKALVHVPEELNTFFETVIKNKSKSAFLKKINYWSSKFTFNDLIFTLKRITK